MIFENPSKNNNDNISKNVFEIFNENENNLIRKLNNFISFKKFNIFLLISISLSYNDNIIFFFFFFLSFFIRIFFFFLILILINYYV